MPIKDGEMTNLRHVFPEGSMWENQPWEIRIDQSCAQLGENHAPCRHCRGSSPEWVCPAVVVAYNEAGYCSTGICLQCILEVVRTTPELQPMMVS